MTASRSANSLTSTARYRVARRSLFGALLFAVSAFLLLASPAPESRAAAAADDYIVLFRASEEASERARAERQKGNRVEDVFTSRVNGLVAELDRADVKRLRDDPRVLAVERDGVVRALAARDSLTSLWGLDRIDQRTRPGNGRITTATDGAGVTAYVVDTGIRADHVEFEGRVRSTGYTAIADGRGWTDCDGHGTHVAGTVAGKSYGVAPKAELVSVRVLSCTGSGTWSGVIAGIDWIASDHQAGQPAVANLSLGGGYSATVNAAIQRAVDDGVTVAVAAGNETSDACTRSPASAPAALTVGSTTSTDARSSFSNYGTCLDIFAPGSGILSAGITSSTASLTLSGTSMASPHVAGAAALVLSGEGGLTPAQVGARLAANSTTGLVTSPGAGSLNRLLYVGDASDGNPLPEPEPEPEPPPPAPPANDAFLNATTLASLSGTTGTNVSATKETAEPSHGAGSARSVWYRWTAPSDGSLTLSTQGSSYDTLLAAYSGSSLGSLVQLAANDDVDGSNLWSRITIPVTSGAIYRVAVDGWSGASGAISLSGSFTATPPPPEPEPPAPEPPANDAFAAAVELASLSGTTGTNLAATRESGEPDHGWGASRSVWYRWTAPSDGSLTLSTEGSGYDTVLAAYSGSSLGALAKLAANDDASSSVRWSRITFPVASGTIYRVVVDGYYGASGSISLSGSFTATPPPPPPPEPEPPAPPPDTTPPEPPVLTATPDPVSYADSATFAFTGEPGATFECSLDSGSWQACSSPRSLSGLAQGDHTFRVRQTDAAGNVSATARFEWEVRAAVEGRNPILTGPDYDGMLSFSGAAAGETYLCRVGASVSGPLRECETPFAPEGLTDGSYSYRLAITDERGNRSAEASGTFEVTGTPAPPPGQVGVSINGGDIFTRDREVALDLVWPAGTREVIVANDGSLAGDPVAVGTPLPWTLRSSGSERLPKTVYVRFLGAGGTVLGTQTDDIVLDETAPTVSDGRLLRRAKGRFTMRLPASDEGSGLSRFQFAGSAKRPTGARTVTALRSSRAVGRVIEVSRNERPRWFRVSDRAGNWSVWAPIRRQSR